MKQYKDLVTSFVRSWNVVRTETLEILNSLDDKSLQFKPQGERWQPIYYQFGCLLRTQQVYAKAIMEGKMDFSWFHDKTLFAKTNFQTRLQLLKALEDVDREWIRCIRQKREQDDFVVRWPGVKMALPNHITALISHERLHHGQLISYFTLANKDLPKGFKMNWAL